MEGYDALVVAILVIVAVFAVAAILIFAGAGAASGYVAGRRSPSSTGRSGALAGLAIGATVGVADTLLVLFLFFEEATWAAILFLMIGALCVIVAPALFAYRRDLRISRVLVLLALGVVVVVVAIPVALFVVTWLNEPGGPPPPDDSLLWQYETGNHGELVVVSALADGVLYAVSYMDFIYALNAESGDLLWKFESESSDLSPPLTVDSGIVYAAGARPVGAGSELFALDAYTGVRLRNKEPMPAASPHGDGISYVSVLDSDTYDLNVRAIDESSGELMWEADVQRSSWLHLLFPLTASGGNVYVSDEDTVHALDSTTGKLAWSFADDSESPIQSPPLAADGVVFLRSYSAAYALNESTGDPLWRYESDIGSGLPDRPVIMADDIWFLAEDGRVIHALDAATGQILWSYEDDFVSFISGVANGMVFVTGGFSDFYALDVATGKEKWSLDADWGLSLGEVTVVDGVLYATSPDGYLHTLDARTGEPIWSLERGSHVGGTKTYLVSRGVVYMGYRPTSWTTGEGEPSSGIYAFKAPHRR